MEVFNGSLQRMLAQKKFGKPLDNKQILCYNKDVPRDGMDFKGVDHLKDTNRTSYPIGARGQGFYHSSLKAMEKRVKKTLDRKQILCYNKDNRGKG